MRHRLEENKQRQVVFSSEGGTYSRPGCMTINQYKKLHPITKQMHSTNEMMIKTKQNNLIRNSSENPVAGIPKIVNIKDEQAGIDADKSIITLRESKYEDHNPEKHTSKLLDTGAYKDSI